VALTVCPARAQEAINLPITHYKLKNGLEVVLSEDVSLPLVSVAVTYKVGSIDEARGKTGLAYLMENLMFSGSANVSPLQYIYYIHRVGGVFNAAASEDKTIFYQTVPSNQVALVLWLESDRMRSLSLTETAFDRARNSVLDEIRERKMNEPYLESSFSFDQILYPDFPYSHPLSGSEADLGNLSLDDVRNFYSAYYVPNNAILCLTGNFQKLKTMELVSKYFETIPPGKETNPPEAPLVPAKKRVVRTFEDGLASSPAVHLGFRLPSPSSEEFYTLASSISSSSGVRARGSPGDS